MTETRTDTGSRNAAAAGMRTMVYAAAGVAAATLLTSRAARAVSPAITFSQIPGTGDVKVLNYALALEALEADLYVQALARLTGGAPARADGTPAVIGLNGSATGIDAQYVAEFAAVEASHRNFLNSALGTASIIGTDPTNGILNGATFNFGINSLDAAGVIKLLYTVENTGTMAYLGAIPSFATHTYLATAAAIQGTEARHTAIIAIVNNLLYSGENGFIETAPLVGEPKTILGSANSSGIDGTLDPDTVLAAVSPWIVLPG